MNIAKITAEPPIFGTTGPNGADVKKLKPSEVSKLKTSGVNFDMYQIREGEILRFPKLEDMDIAWRSISKGSKNGFYLVKCESEYNGKTKPTWFSLPSLRKLDKDNVPVNPSWYDLGNDQARLEMLAKIGQIEGLHKVDIKVYVLDETGKRKQTQLLNEDGSPQIVNGKEVWEDQTRDAHPVTITPCDDVESDEPASDEGTSE